MLLRFVMPPKQNALTLGAAYYMAHCIPNQEPWKSLLFHQLPLGQVGELCKVKRIVKLNVMVQSANGFEEQPEVRHTWLCVFPTYQKQLIACFKGG